MKFRAASPKHRTLLHIRPVELYDIQHVLGFV
jgi:hypothetical protein